MSRLSTSVALASAARTTSSESASVAAKSAVVALHLNVTAASGTSPTLDVSLEWSVNGTDWNTAQPVDSLTQVTGVSAVVKRFDVKGSFLRVKYVIAGTTPSFTFSANVVHVF